MRNMVIRTSVNGTLIVPSVVASNVEVTSVGRPRTLEQTRTVSGEIAATAWLSGSRSRAVAAAPLMS